MGSPPGLSSSSFIVIGLLFWGWLGGVDESGLVCVEVGPAAGFLKIVTSNPFKPMYLIYNVYLVVRVLT